jgi:hypothetical protein
MPVTIRQEGDDAVITIRVRPLWQTGMLAAMLVCGAGAFLWVCLRWVAEDLRVGGDGLYRGMDVAMAVIAGSATFFAARLGCRALFSREVITTDSSVLAVGRGAPVVWLRERFAIPHVRRLRAAPEAKRVEDGASEDPWACVEGRNIAFDYGPRTVRFGLRLREEDARKVVAAIRLHASISDTPYAHADASWSADVTPDGIAGPPAPRAVVNHDRGHLSVTVKVHRNPFFAVLGALGVAGAGLLTVMLVPYLWRGGVSRWIAVLHTLLAIGALTASVRAMMWTLSGSEELTTGADGMCLIVRRSGWARQQRSFALREMKRLRVVLRRRLFGPVDPWGERGSIMMIGEGGVCDFGIGLDEAEAEAIVRLLRETIGAARGGVEPSFPV